MNSQPKFSILPLPGDDWETRRTKEIIRNMVRIKDMQGFTTQEVVDRCNDFLGEEDKIKMSTLNGLFAGKRKSITASELEMFATALDVPLLGLLYPPQEDRIEVRPGYFVQPEYAIRVATATWKVGDGDSPLNLERARNSRHDPVSHGVYIIITTWAAGRDFHSVMMNFYDAVDNDASDETLSYLLNAALPAVSAFHHGRKQLMNMGIEPSELPAFFKWVDNDDSYRMTLHTAKAYYSQWAEVKAEKRDEFKQLAVLDRKWVNRRSESQRAKTA